MFRQRLGSATDPFVVDSDSESEHDGTQNGGRGRAAAIDLIGSLSPRPRRLQAPTPELSSWNVARPILPVPKSMQPIPMHSRAPSTRSTPSVPSQRLTAIQTTSGTKIKSSPQPICKTQKVTTQLRPQLVAENAEDVLSDQESEEEEVQEDQEGGQDEENELPTGNQNLRASPETPSRRSSRCRPSSRISFEGSIGSSSPLVTRLREQKSRIDTTSPKTRLNHSPRGFMAPRNLPTQQSHRQQLTLGEMEESLRGFERGVHENHSEMVRWLLCDAKRDLEKLKSPFVEKVSPFASMQPLYALPGDTVPDGTSIVKMESYINRKKVVRGRTQVITKRIPNFVSRVPKYSSHRIVKRNILSGDDEKLKFIPFLGDAGGSSKNKATFNRLVKELEDAYSAKRSGSSRESEEASKIRTYLSDWLYDLNMGCDLQALICYILEQDSSDLGKTRKEIKVLCKSFGGPLSPDIVKGAKTFSQAFKNVFNLSLKDVILPDERLKEMLEFTKKSNPDNSPPSTQSGSPRNQINGAEQSTERLGTFTNLICLICGAACCQTHGDYNSVMVAYSDDSAGNGPEEFQYTHQPLGMNYNDMLRKQNVRMAAKQSEVDLSVKENSVKEPCSDDCHLNFECCNRDYEWTRENISVLKNILLTMRYEETRSCDISFLLGLPCWQVHCEITHAEGRREVPILPTSSPGRKRPDWYDNKRKTLKSDWQDLTSAHLHQERCQANPCAHNGPCQSGCPCFASNLLCENFCGCPNECPRKFTGCACHSSGVVCVSDTCICIQMNRECGPQCVSCGAIPRINPMNKYDEDLFATGCQNIMLQRGVDRKLMIGESQLDGVGFGLYIGEPVRKGDYLSEYTGEVISFAEADRRGIIYDRKYLSFLFDLNSEWCIDAARLGNKTRFINHADNEKDGLNCEAKIFLVNGEHRIKFVALRDIDVGEELLFNYGKKFAEKHGLSKKLPKTNEGGKKGVVVGEEALKVLDGLDPRNRVTRGKMTAIRGGHSSARVRKARKTAPIRDLVAEVERAVEDEAANDLLTNEEDDEDDDIRDRKRKRKITRPLRYTR